MVIICQLKQISPEILDEFKKNPSQVNWFFKSRWDRSVSPFASEWDISPLDLNKHYWEDLTVLLAGYQRASNWSVKDKRLLIELTFAEYRKSWPEFLVIDNSQWDGLPLVNAILSGREIGPDTGYGPARYLLPEEVEIIASALDDISVELFAERYEMLSYEVDAEIYIDWSEEEMLQWLTDYYICLCYYYREAARQKQAMLIYFC